MKTIDLLCTLAWRGIHLDPQNVLKLRQQSLINIEEVLLELIQKYPQKKLSLSKMYSYIKTGEKELMWLEKNHCHWLSYGESEYPKKLLNIPHPPLILTYRGNLAGLNRPLLGVVGSRKPNNETLAWLDEYLLQVQGFLDFTIVSGGARGVDQKAHAMAIRGGCPTLCFLPSGLDNLYPSSLMSWIGPILASGGAFVSQFSPFEPMFKGHFHRRNGLIAALSDFLLVGEARRKSGSLLTAKMGLELDIPIGVLPCSPMVCSGLGGLDLLSDGALLIRDHVDLGMALRQANQSQLWRTNIP